MTIKLAKVCLVVHGGLKWNDVLFWQGADVANDQVSEKKPEGSKDAHRNSVEHEVKSFVEAVKEKAAEA